MRNSLIYCFCLVIFMANVMLMTSAFQSLQPSFSKRSQILPIKGFLNLPFQKSQLPAITSNTFSVTRAMAKSDDSPYQVVDEEGLYIPNSPGALFKRYGYAYLLTSITLSIISFSSCYYLVKRGVDVPRVLARHGFKAEQDLSIPACTLTIAYLCHKALSPVRFFPTLLLSPIVAKLIGRREVRKISDKKKAEKNPEE